LFVTQEGFAAASAKRGLPQSDKTSARQKETIRGNIFLRGYPDPFTKTFLMFIGLKYKKNEKK
jgi:hypothetical protein